MLLKQSFPAHLDAVLDIVSSSLQHGVFPACFKLADVTPVLKADKPRTALSSYRPVSNLPFLAKVLERIVVDRLQTHLDRYNLNETFQSAYKKKHSCESALLRIQNDIATSLDENKCVMLALIDLSAAFDTIDHAKLIHLLEHEYGVRGTALHWFSSYLSERYFQVKVGGIRSEPRQVTCGVPQGSVLGPIMFNLYIRPLCRVIENHNLHYHIYADDVQIYGSFFPTLADSTRVVSQFQECLGQIRAWMLLSGLKINDLKTELITFANPQQVRLLPNLGLTSITFAGTTVNVSTAVRDLGAILDCHLERDAHVSAVVKSCNFHLFQLFPCSSLYY